MLVFLLLLVPHLCVLSQVRATEQSYLLNDDYCDALDGSDETTTSACSHLSSITFPCRSNGRSGVTNVTIPVSRINDGVCDCCDGSDESSTSHPACPDTCEAQVMEEKQKALAMHRNIQSGMRVRTEIFEAQKHALSKDSSQIAQLRMEYQTIDSMLLRMLVLLPREEAKETQVRFALIRERENRCALGVESNCDFFRAGFMDEDELMHEGYPIEYANPAKRFHYQHSAAEIEHLSRATGLEKVKLTICAEKDLLPDEDARIFTKVNELLTFAASPGGKVAREQTTRQRKLDTLFGRFLENGDKGLIRGKLFLLEMLGLALSPATLLYRALHLAVSHTSSLLWDKAVACANTPLGGSRELDVSVVGTRFPESYVELCQIIVQSDVEGSVVANALSLLDYSRYSVVMTVMDVWEDSFITPAWMWEVIYRAPVLYLDYYLTDKAAQLPPRRQACLLRAAIKTANTELAVLLERIRAREELAKQNALKRYIRIPKITNTNTPINKKRRSRHKSPTTTTSTTPDEVLVPLDFGPGGIWESQLNTCLTETIGDHSYSFCYFGEIRQDNSVSLGHFAAWGNGSTSSVGSVGSSYVIDGSNGNAGMSVGMNGETMDSFDGIDYTDQYDDTYTTQTNPVDTIHTTLSSIQPYLAPLYTLFSYTTSYLTSVVDYLTYSNRIVGLTPTGRNFLHSVRKYLNLPTIYGLEGVENDPNSTPPGAFSSLFGTNTDVLPPQRAMYEGQPELQQVYYSHQLYQGGTACWPRQGMPRRSSVLFECGMHAKITDVMETEVCVYQITVSTPLVCTRHLESTSLQRLEYLGVFGFAKPNGSGSGGSGKGGSGGSSASRSSRGGGVRKKYRKN